MRITKKLINQTIKERFGKDVHVYIDHHGAHFYSDDPRTGLLLARTNTGVAVARLNHLSLEQWMREFEMMWDSID